MVGTVQVNTQAKSLLDLMTIYQEFGHFDGLKVCIAGTWIIHVWQKSNMQILKRFGSNPLLCRSDEWKVRNLKTMEVSSLSIVIEEVDVMMFLRVQHERHDYESLFSKETTTVFMAWLKKDYDRMKDTAILMHPAPVNRDVEIADHW